MLLKCLSAMACIIAIALAIVLGVTYYLYQVVDEGELYLKHARGTSVILREADTGIAHIRGDNRASVAYAQGFAHAQTRLWQLERTRRVFNGEISELFGEDTLKLDKFMRQVGFRRHAEKAWDLLEEEHREILQAYADGINDQVNGINLVLKSSTGKLLPPEFYIFGLSDLTTWRPWHPIDTLALMKFKSYNLSWNWMNDLGRESLRQIHPDLADLADELNPFKSEDFIDQVTTVDDEDLKKFG